MRIDPGVGQPQGPAIVSSEVMQNDTEVSPDSVAEVAHQPVPLVETQSAFAHEYFPETHEPNYSYPLIVWVTAPGQEFHLARTMDSVSDRNYLGLQFDLGRFMKGTESDESFVRQLHSYELILQKALRASISRFRRNAKVHSERIYLAGLGQGAVAALQLGLSRPEWFGGVISIDVGTDRIPNLLSQFRHLQGKRVLLAHSRGATAEQRTGEHHLARMLFSSGLRVCRRSYATTHPSPRNGRFPALYRDIDRWVMQDILQAQFS